MLLQKHMYYINNVGYFFFITVVYIFTPLLMCLKKKDLAVYETMENSCKRIFFPLPSHIRALERGNASTETE